MTKPYGIVSDIHAHNWSAFSTTGPNGVNSRLQSIIDEVKRCASEVKKAGGNLIINAGDVFHVRGSLAPSVLNPIMDLHRELILDDMEVVIIPGNHDAELKDVTRLSSAVTALEGIGCTIINEITPKGGVAHYGNDFLMVPWMPSVSQLKDAILLGMSRLSKSVIENTDLIIHAPVDGVIIGIPDHGIDAAWLGSLGFRHVFSGHYHHHKYLGDGVWSIGAINHHTWSDVNTKAGFLVVDGEDVKWFKSHAPEFVEIDSATDPAEIPMIVDGNYVRIKTSATDITEIEGIRELLIDNGAKGVTIISQREASVSPRGTASVASGMSLEASVSDYVSKGGFDDPKALEGLCVSILGKAKEAEGV